MNQQPMLTDQEIQILLDLLRAEREELPVEIHHTDSPTVGDQLDKRLKLVDQLIAKLEHAPVH